MIEHFPRAHTRERILDRAEQLFVEHGINATSMRDITQAAEVNLSAVNYYFGSKDGLVQAAFQRHYLPFIKACSQALRTLPASAQIGDIIDALLKPLEKLATLPHNRGFTIVNLLGRILCEHAPLVRKQIVEYSPEVTTPLLHMLHMALPDIPLEHLRRRMYITFKVLFNSLNGRDLFNIYAENPASRTDIQSIVAELHNFLEAGLSSPPPPDHPHPA